MKLRSCVKSDSTKGSVALPESLLDEVVHVENVLSDIAKEQSET